jgi:uncharacterized damage-inducible protein DinB
MSKSLMDDAFAHHTWATLQLIDVCLPLTPEQFDTGVPGTYGSILDTFRHLVGADSWYLSDMTDQPSFRIDEEKMDLNALRDATTVAGAGWSQLLATDVDPDLVVREVDEDDGFQRDATMGIRLAQALDHGTTHRSQICTVLTTLGVDLPPVDAWDYGEATGLVTDYPPPS